MTNRRLKQCRHFTDDSTLSNVTKAQLTSTTAFLSSGEKAVSIGVQAPPNTTFKINGGDNITMGRTGIFEWDIDKTGIYIESFQFVTLASYPANLSDPATAVAYIVDFYLEE